MMYQCIHCGKVIDLEKASLCPDCGYKMFQVPFERSEVLRNEIQGYFCALSMPPLLDDELCYTRKEPAEKQGEKEKTVYKEDDDERFPDFAKLRRYVCNSEKTEIFRARLKQSLSEIARHIHDPYSQEYEVDFAAYERKIKELNLDLEKALEIVGLKVEISDYVPSNTKLMYAEQPDADLLPIADEILAELDKLTDKIERFIRQNNIYGQFYQESVKVHHPDPKKEGYDPKALLTDCLSETKQAVEKNYTLDVFSDGAVEMKEMLHQLWSAVVLLMECPILEKRYKYIFGGIEITGWDNFRDAVMESCSARCPGITSIPALHELTEGQLWDTYNELIAIDSHDLLGVSKSSLLQAGKSEKKLAKLVGLQSIKESILKIKAYALANKDSDMLNLHMCFYGNPGTGKTEVARLIAGILYENKILPTDHFIEVDRGGLVGQYVGETPQKTMSVIHRAMGGVLFVDEAYALVPKEGGGWDYGHEAIATLIKAMEDYRGKFCVILAGYKKEMEAMLATNPGFVSRIQFTLDFPNYSKSELGQILQLMIDARKYTISESAKDRILDVTDILRKNPNFANARDLRNIIEQVIMSQSVRVFGSDNREIGAVDVEKYISDAKLHLPAGNNSKKVLTGEEELEQLIGLSAVKKVVKKIRIYAMRNKDDENFNLHMCFFGNPGTGKTEVARIISRVLYDAGVLAEAKVVETDAHGLMGKAVGETAPKTLEKINEAEGGVLFIDEAYALISSNNSATTYGADALSVLLKEMEDRRGRICVIFAGYRDQIKEMLSSNPGLESRIQFKLDFPDYTRDELSEIAVFFLRKKGYEIETDALSMVLDVADYFRSRDNFANARTVRNVLDQVLLNQNLRAEDNPSDKKIILEDVSDYIQDEEIDLSKKDALPRKIGFV